MQLQTSEQCAQAEVSVPHSKSGILQYDRNNLQLKTSNILKHATNTNEERSNKPWIPLVRTLLKIVSIINKMLSMAVGTLPEKRVLGVMRQGSCMGRRKACLKVVLRSLLTKNSTNPLP